MSEEQKPEQEQDPGRRRRVPPVVWMVAAALVVIAGIGAVIGLTRTTTADPADSPGPTPTPTLPSFPSIAPPTSSPISIPTPPPTAAPGTPTPNPEADTPLEGTGTVAQNMSFTVTSVEAVQGEAIGPGEVAGPSVRFTLVAVNTTGQTVDLSNTVVNAYYGEDASPASPLSGPGAQAFPVQLESGRQATGIFVFSIPEDQRDLVRLEVDYSVETPVLAFEGPAPR